MSTDATSIITDNLQFFIPFSLVFGIFTIICFWKVFNKAKENGWAAIIPFYSNYVQFKIAFGNGWLFLLLLVPLVNIVVAIMLPFKLAKAFGKGPGFGVGLWLIPIVFYAILAFGNSKYVGISK